MDKKIFISSFVVALGFIIIFLFIDFKISIGVLFGYAFSLLNYKAIEYRYTDIEKKKDYFALLKALSISLLVIPLLISFLLPNIISFIGTAIGLFIIKIIIIVNAFIKKA